MIIRRYALALFAVILPAITLNAAEPGRNSMPSFTWGARIGFAATGTYLTNAIIDGHNVTDYIQDTQVGNFIALQFRWSSPNFLIQSGVGISHNKSSFIADKNSWNPEATAKADITYSYSLTSLMVPLQIGYHIVNRSPYCMSAFTGPRLRYIPEKYYVSSCNGMQPYSFTEKPVDILIGWTAGLSVQIGRTFLDFEYECTINSISRSLTETSGTLQSPDFKLDRRMGIISFSYGIMF